MAALITEGADPDIKTKNQIADIEMINFIVRIDFL